MAQREPSPFTRLMGVKIISWTAERTESELLVREDLCNRRGVMHGGAVMAWGDTLGGIISDAIFRRTGDLRLARRTLLVAGLGGALAFMLPAITIESALGAVWLLGAAFFFLELTNAVLWTLPLDIAGLYAGTAGGIMNTGFGVAGMMSPIVFGVLIEHYAGAFPAWLAPIQAVVAPISEHQAAYGEEIAARLRAAGFRIELDASNEKIGYKIRHWKVRKVPYVIVVGKSEAAQGTVNVNERGVEERRTVSIDAFVEELRERISRKR